MGDLVGPLTEFSPRGGARLLAYDVWCECARLLLGWTEDAGDIRPDLYAADFTPLAAVRQMVLGREGVTAA